MALQQTEPIVLCPVIRNGMKSSEVMAQLARAKKKTGMIGTTGFGVIFMGAGNVVDLQGMINVFYGSDGHKVYARVRNGCQEIH